MKKRFLLDTNVLLRSPRAIFVFEENDVLICHTTLEELDNLKIKPGEVGYEAREAIRTINNIRVKEIDGSLNKGVSLSDGGTFRIVSDYIPENEIDVRIPKDWSFCKPDNRIISTASHENAILVTNDVAMMIKAESAGVQTQNYRNEQVSDENLKYTGRTEVLVSPEALSYFAEKKTLSPSKLYSVKKYKQFLNGETFPESLRKYCDEKPLEVNEFIVLRNVCTMRETMLGYFDGKLIRALRYAVPDKLGDIMPRNVAQTFALEALLAPADEIPLVILKGPAGTAKTFLMLAAGIKKVMEDEEYRKILLLRPNVKFDEDIGYLKGTEADKILPLIRPSLDNLDALLGKDDDSERERQSKIKYLFDSGIITAEALAYLRGRSVNNQYVAIDEAQNSSPLQMLGIITRAGIGSKFVVVGDPDQIDNPKLDRNNNGLVFAADKMRGSKYCMQITFSEEECVRSELAQEASKLLNSKR